MIEFEDILSAAQSQLALAFPRRPNVENLQVKDFDRPSFYFRWTASQVSDASRAALRVQRTLEIICFEALRDVNSQQSDLRALLDTQQMVFRLFSAGYLTVGDRALHMTAKLGEVDSDAATVELAFDYLDARPETQQDCIWICVRRRNDSGWVCQTFRLYSRLRRRLPLPKMDVVWWASWSGTPQPQGAIR